MIRLLPVATLIAALSAPAMGQGPCAKAPGRAVNAFFIEPARAGARDSLVVGRLCLATTQNIGSYTAVLTYDTARMRVVSLTTTGGMQASNARVAGVVRLAGAAPNGFAPGPLASITFKPAGGRALGRVGLTLSEANGTNGRSLVADVRAFGWPLDQGRAAPPVIDSISPRSAEISAERVTDLVLYGRGFAEANNTIVFGGAELTGLVSENGGTVLRFLAPAEVPARGSTPAHRITPGRIQVRVRHARGASNAVTFIAKGER